MAKSILKRKIIHLLFLCLSYQAYTLKLKLQWMNLIKKKILGIGWIIIDAASWNNSNFLDLLT